MDRTRLQIIVGSAMVGLGLLQGIWGGLRNDLVFSIFGLTYALLGAMYLWFEALPNNQHVQ